ncbi:MAG: SigE family RNA polymerase sigma factor [Mycobacteriales bacterium]
MDHRPTATASRYGDHTALEFDAYVAARSSRLLRTASLLVGTHDAADVVQNALIGLYRRWDAVTAAENPDAYVQRSLVNAALQWRRRRRPLVLPAVVDVEGHAESVSERQDMLRALAMLPPRQRAVVVLAFYDDRSEAEIATAMRCSQGTVKSQKSRALATLRAALGAEMTKVDTP